MIRQLCPHCEKLVELPDTAAGGTADCPLCAKLIVVPAAYAPSVASGGGLASLPPPPVAEPPKAAPPPGLKPEVPNPPPAPQPDAVPPTPGVPTGYGRVMSLTFSPGWLAWVPVAGITFAVVLTLFTWAGTYPGGIRVYSQNPWWALFGDMTTDPGPAVLQSDETEIAKLLTGNRWLLGYLPLLLLGTFLLWVERVVKNPTIQNMPGPLAWLPGLWPKRFALLTVLTGLLLTFLVFQGLRGFGLESALREHTAGKFAKKLEEANASNTTIQKQTVAAEMGQELPPLPAGGSDGVRKQTVAAEMGQEFAKYHYQTTIPFRLAVLAHVLAFAAMLTRWWLHRRGAKPYPRLLMQW